MCLEHWDHAWYMGRFAAGRLECLHATSKQYFDSISDASDATAATASRGAQHEDHHQAYLDTCFHGAMV